MILALLVLLSGPIDLIVRETVSIAPSTVTARARVVPDESNREACVTLYLEGLIWDQRCWTLNGANENGTFPIQWKRLGPGEYLAVLSVQTTTGILDKTQGFYVHP